MSVKSVSEIVGRADSAGRSNVVVYRALRQLLCAACGGMIEEGAMFTRRSLTWQGLRILPKYRKCAPFELKTGNEEERQGSSLLKALLAPQEESRRNGRPRRRQEAVRKAVENRLGPALRRSSGSEA